MIRPSDITRRKAQMYGNLAGLVRSAGGLVGGIVGQVYEADRVSQVNRQLAYLEQSYQEYNQGLDQQMFDARGEELSSMGHPMSTGSVVKKPFGQATLADIEADEDKFFQKQLEYITKNTTNKKARQEMIQHLQMKNIQNKGIVAGKWHVAADDEARAGLIVHNNTVLASNDPWEVKVNKIATRVREMVHVGRLRKSEGENIIAKVTAAVQYSFAHNGAMTMMKQTGDPAAGEAWLKENTPFYDSNPDAREQILGDVRREFDYFAKTEDEKVNDDFADLYARADTIEKAEMGLSTVRDMKVYDGELKYTWTQRFKSHLQYLKNLEKMPDPDDAYKKKEDWLRGFLAIELDRGRHTRDQLKKIVADLFYGIDKDGTGIPQIRGPAAQWAFDYLKREADPAVKLAMDILDETLKGKNIPAAEAAPLINAYQDWLLKNPNADSETMTQAAINIVKPVATRNLSEKLDRTLEVILGDKAVKTKLEELTEDIENYDYVGIQDMEGRRELLTQYNAALLDKAQKEYPGENILEVYTDETGEYTGFPGTAMLISAAQRAYIYKLDGKVLTLWGRLLTRGGKFEWQLIGETGIAKAEEELLRKEEAAAKKEAEEIERKKILEERKTGWGR